MKPPDVLLENTEQSTGKSLFKAIKPDDEQNKLKLNLIDDDEINAMRMEDSYVLDRVSPFYYFNPLGDTISIGTNAPLATDEKKPYDAFEDHTVVQAPAPPPPLKDGFLCNVQDIKQGLTMKKPASMPLLMDFVESDGSDYSPSSAAMVPSVLSDDDDLFEGNLFGSSTGGNAMNNMDNTNWGTTQMT